MGMSRTPLSGRHTGPELVSRMNRPAGGGSFLYARVAGRGESLFCCLGNRKLTKRQLLRIPAPAAFVNPFTSTAHPGLRPSATAPALLYYTTSM